MSIQRGIAHHILVPECEDISLEERCKRANELKSDLPKVVISIHGNAAGVESANGYEVFTSPGRTQSDDFATIFYHKAQELTHLKMRQDFSDGDPDKESRFYILIHTAMPCILTESGFYTNPNECRRMLSDAFRDTVALAHFEAILHIEKYGLNPNA